MTATTTATIRGTVQRSNGSTVLLEERVAPLTISRYAKNIPPMEGGDMVELVVDGRDFVMGGVNLSLQDHGDDEPDERRALPCKDVQIIRESCLKSAAAFAVSRPEMKSADVLKVAECWEQWILR